MRRARTSRAAVLGLLFALPWAALGCGTFGGGPSENEKAIVEGHKQFQEVLERQRAQSAARDEPTEEEPKTIPELLQEGDRHRTAGRPEQAIYAYYRAYKKNPEAPEPIERIAYVHLAQDPSRAQALFQSVLEQHPKRASALSGLALAELGLERNERALLSAEKAVALEPDSAHALAALGLIQDRLGDHERAQRSLGRASELRPRDPVILNNLGVAYLLGGDLDRAEETLRRGILVAPRNRALRNDLGLVLARQERYEDALEEFRKGGDEQAAQNNLGYAYHLAGRYEDAIRHYEKALLAGGPKQEKVMGNLRAAVASRGPTEPLIDEVDVRPLGRFGVTETLAAEETGPDDGPASLPVVDEFSFASERAAEAAQRAAETADEEEDLVGSEGEDEADQASAPAGEEDAGDPDDSELAEAGGVPGRDPAEGAEPPAARAP